MPTLPEMLHMTGVRELLLAVILFMLSIIVVLFAVLIIHKLYVEHRSRRYGRLKSRYIGQLGKRLFDGDVRLDKPERYHEYDAWADVVAEMLANCLGETAERIKDEARGLNLGNYYREMAHTRSWMRRFIAVEKLGLMKLPEMKELYRSILQSEKDPHIISKTVWALSMVADEDVPAEVNKLLKNPAFMSSKFTEFIYTNIISSFRDAGLDESFLKFLGNAQTDHELPLVLKRDIIAACGSAQFFPARNLIRDYFSSYHNSPEMRIACIRALERLSDDKALQIFAEGVGDPDWRVRAVAAKSAYICGESVLGRLRTALRDRHYYVRMNAALSLAKLGPPGIAALSDVVQEDDRFAGDVARYVLKR
jgi:HEAT repeat protein